MSWLLIELGGQSVSLLGVASIGFVLGVFATICYFQPDLLAVLAKLMSIVFLATGVGVLVWGILSVNLEEPVHPPFNSVMLMRSTAECIAWGSGLLAAGLLCMVFGFVGFRRKLP